MRMPISSLTSPSHSAFEAVPTQSNSSSLARGCSYCYWRVFFMHFCLWLIPRLRRRSRSRALTVTKQARGRMATSSETGVASGGTPPPPLLSTLMVLN